MSTVSSPFTTKLESQRRYLTCTTEGPRDVACFGYAGSFSSLGVDDSFTLEKFKNEVKFEIKELSEDRVIFELINVDVSIVNAIRRILIAEVPTIAIETIHLWLNTGVIQDEVLAHRLGLIPFKFDPDLIQWRKENEDLTDENCLKFRLHVKCSEKDIPLNSNSLPVYAKDLKWVPMSHKQEARFGTIPPVPVEPDVLITKLRPGQEIEADLFCEKGIGKTHAKWSPVATAVYRLLPVLTFPNGPLKGIEAEELKTLCPMNVFDIEDGISTAPRARNCTTCRACLERFPNHVTLLKDKRHFIFTIESTRSIPATVLFETAINVLKNKAQNIRENLQSSLGQIVNN